MEIPGKVKWKLGTCAETSGDIPTKWLVAHDVKSGIDPARRKRILTSAATRPSDCVMPPQPLSSLHLASDALSSDA